MNQPREDNSHFQIFQPSPGHGDQSEAFKVRFKSSLEHCLRRGFKVEETFGLIWMETIEEIALSETEQPKIYNELLIWAKNLIF